MVELIKGQKYKYYSSHMSVDTVTYTGPFKNAYSGRYWHRFTTSLDKEFILSNKQVEYFVFSVNTPSPQVRSQVNTLTF